MAKARKRHDSKYLFYVLYGIEFVLAVTFGVISRLDYLWSVILAMTFLASLYVTAYIQELIAHHKRFDIVYYSLIFLGGAALFVLQFCSKGIFTLIAVLHSAAMMCLIFFRYIMYVRATGDTTALETKCDDNKPWLAAISLLICAMVQMLYVNYVSEMYMAWSFIPAAAICTVITTIIYALLQKTLKMMSRPTFICLVIIIFGLSYSYCCTSIGIANCAFDYSKPTPIECTVLDKDIRTGTRTPTQYEIKIKISGKTEWIDVTYDEYYAICKGETITVNRFSGALGIAYYEYEEQ